MLFGFFNNVKGAIPEQASTDQIYLPLVLNKLMVRQIAFVGSPMDNPDPQNIYVVKENGTQLKNLSNNPLPTGTDSHFSWSADGKEIVFSSNRDGNYEIYLMSADGTNVSNITNHPGKDSSPAIAPDGNKIVFSSNRNGSLQVYTMNVDGSNVVQLTDNLDTVGMQLTWAPDMSKIGITAGNLQGQTHMMIMNPDGSNLENITVGESSRNLVWSPDSADVIFGSDRDNNETDLFLLNLTSRDVIKLTNTGNNQGGVWSPDGTRIAYTRHSDDKIYLIDRDGSNQTELTCNYGNPDTYEPGHLSWSPGGTQLAFSTSSCQIGVGFPCGVYTISVDGNQCTQIVQMFAYGLQWQPEN